MAGGVSARRPPVIPRRCVSAHLRLSSHSQGRTEGEMEEREGFNISAV